MWSKLMMAVAWPAFLAACLLEAVVFAVVDPLELSWGDGPLGWSRQAVYTVAFFVFWAAALMSSLTALTLLGPGGGQPPEPAHE